MQKSLQEADLSIVKLLKERNKIEEEIKQVKSTRAKIPAQGQQIDKMY